MIDKLKDINNELIKLNLDKPTELKKYKLIKKILDDENSFMKIDVNIAYAILRDLRIPEQYLKEVYIQLLEIK